MEMSERLYWSERKSIGATTPNGVGEWRVWYLSDPAPRALRFALELNSQAIDSIGYARAGHMLDEGAHVLEANIREYGATFEHVQAVVQLLSNRGQLRDLYEEDSGEVLEAACNACERSVALARGALATSIPEWGAAGQRVELELKRLLMGSLISQSRALSDAGDSYSSRIALREARSLLDELRSSSTATEVDDIELQEEMIADAQRILDGQRREWKRTLWYRSPLTLQE